MSGFLNVLASYGLTTITKASLQKIIASDVASQSGANFGSSVAISGDNKYIVIGSYLAGSDDTGAAYVYYNNKGHWEEQAKLVASNAVAGDWFGYAVDITATGDRIIVGAPHANALPYNQDNSGAAYIFQRSGTTWTEELYLSGGDGGTNDYWGGAVAINDDGTAIIIGAYGDDGSGTDIGYVHTFLINGDTWAGVEWDTDDALLPIGSSESNAHHGWSVACNYNSEYCIAGGPGDNNQSKTDSGSVTIHHRNLGVPGWKHVSNTAWATFMNSYAVWSGAASGNTDRSFSFNVNFPTTGDYLFSYMADNTITWDIDSGTSETHSGYTGSPATTTLTIDEGEHVLNVTIHNAAGSSGNPAGGAVTITDPSGNIIWTTMELVTTAWVRDIWLESPNAVNSGNYGWSVAMNSTGDRVVIGAKGESPQGVSAAGCAYVYSRSGTVWTLEQQLYADDKTAGDNFGYSVSINSIGDKITIGSLNSDLPIVQDAGSVYVFDLIGVTWTQSAKLTANDAVASDNFGTSVSLNDAGTGLIVGSPNNDPLGSIDSGAAYYFPLTATPKYRPSDSNWDKVVLLILADDGSQGSNSFKDVSNSRLPLKAKSAVSIDTNIKKFGSGSIHFTTSGSCITIPATNALNLSGGPFTIEVWLYPTSHSSGHSCIITSMAGELWLSSSGVLSVFWRGASSTTTSGIAVPLNTWTHVAMVYDGTNVILYQNGVKTNTPKAVGKLPSVTQAVSIGYHGTNVAPYYGYMDEFRITKGVARYSGNFTPPTQSFYQ